MLWKTELEIKYNCKYVLQSAPKVLPTKEKKYFYQCDRSDSKPKDKKSALSVVMKTCSSVISVVEGVGVFKVEYWDTHSGHNDVSPVLVQNELEAAISKYYESNLLVIIILKILNFCFYIYIFNTGQTNFIVVIYVFYDAIISVFS